MWRGDDVFSLSVSTVERKGSIITALNSTYSIVHYISNLGHTLK